MKAAQTEPLQANHQFTPDGSWISSGLPSGSVGEFRSSRCAQKWGVEQNLAQTLMNNCQRSLDYLGLEIDDLD